VFVVLLALGRARSRPAIRPCIARVDDTPARCNRAPTWKARRRASASQLRAVGNGNHGRSNGS
jgi:hypothetical protein